MSYRLFSVSILILLSVAGTTAQQGLKYQMPPSDIVKIVDAPQTPGMSVSPDHSSIILSERSGLITIDELSREELWLAGLRIDPMINGPSRKNYYKGFKIMDIDGSNIREIKDLPEHPRLGDPVWSANGKRFAFTNTRSSLVELWVYDVADLSARKIAEGINTVFNKGFNWLFDNKGILYQVVDPDRGNRPVHARVPAGPVIMENYDNKGQARTYQDLLEDQEDERIFEYYAASRLMLWDGNVSAELGKPGIITEASPSPDGQYFMITLIHRPFSYMVPYRYFPTTLQIWDRVGSNVKTLMDRPLTEDIPRAYDMVLPGPRSYNWRADKMAMVYWAEALDGGDYNNEMRYHDQVYILDAPFDSDPVKLIATELRYEGITWGRDNYAILSEELRKTKQVVISSFSPAEPGTTKKRIQEYNSEDLYADPGSFMTVPNSSGRSVLLFADKGESVFLTGDGASPQGDRPFLDKYEIPTGKSTKLWRSEAPWYEEIHMFIDVSKNIVLTSRQSVTEAPNFFLRNLKNGKVSQVTDFRNPYQELSGISKELVKYRRKDGVELNFTLYLPAGFNRDEDDPLPTLLWAYPRDYIDAGAAGQVSGSPYTFTRISPGSAIVYVTQGYAILMNATFPIVKMEGKEPNDTYIEQLVLNAEAAINKAVEIGVTDRDWIAVSGHSYGAFMTANLLAHSRLFAAGIAESGAYNRTLTPFGFQNERRSYWTAPEVYLRMSPFMHVDQVKDPIMLIHGTADNNEGTFPMQSERFYAALKGFGATVRLVLLPHESHGYASRETILHMHWEVLNWMDKYVKHRE